MAAGNRSIREQLRSPEITDIMSYIYRFKAKESERTPNTPRCQIGIIAFAVR